MIASFSGEYRFLSNFEPVVVVYHMKEYPTLEHAYQAAKTNVGSERERIRTAKTPGAAKHFGKTVTLRGNWNNLKKGIMLDLLRQKFSQEPFKSNLIGTYPIKLVEGNFWGDRYWGCIWMNGEWHGKNVLGELLMQVRQELMSDI